MIFSPQYPSYRRQQILFYFGIYRLMLASALSVLALMPLDTMMTLPRLSADSFLYAALTYVIICIIGLVVTVRGQMGSTPTVVLLLTDILMQSLILHYLGGVGTGFGNLMIVSVAIGSLLLRFQHSLLVAAMAASGAVYTEILSVNTLGEDNLLQAALLGVAFFAVTLLLQYLTSRVRTTEQLARAQADTILDLRHLNELIVQRMRTGIIVTTWEGAIRLMNDAAKDLLGMTEKRAFWLPPPVQERLENWQAEPAERTDPLQMDKDHPLVQLNFAPLQDSPKCDLIIFIEDTGRVQQQAQHLKLASLGRLTASIAHEIRNPLGAISHAAQLLAENDSLDEGDQRLLGIVRNHSNRINTIINNILDMSRQLNLQLEPVYLREFLDECLGEYCQGHIKSDNIKITGDPDIRVRVDPKRMMQVVINLVDNGLRYSELRTGSRKVAIELGTLADTEQPYMDIKDYGPGIAEDQLKHLFEPFYTTEATGTGLGLYIAKELSEANRARLFYTGDENGACFRILFAHAAVQE
ncbi:sensor histidine kinase [Saccharospirillum impatiens]|uniref:sensor histidine kinase n=1 Tax=Saccharospirillum impatiens TaxID=169438 RepID=UPI00041D8098|nr:ATP-binding protein [Saccharospirillum impatiens]